MLKRLALTTALTAVCLAAHGQEPPLTATAEAAGDAARGCLHFGGAVAANARAEDFLSASPAAKFTVTVAGQLVCLEGLAYGAHYAVKVRAGLPFADGSRLGTARTASIDTPDRDAMVAIGGRGWILPRQGATGVSVQTVNVPHVRIRVLRISERQLSATMPARPNSFATRPDPSKQSFTRYELRSLAAGDATEIWSGTMDTKPGRNRTVETAFPLAGIIDPAKPGAFLVLAEDAATPPARLTGGDAGDDDDETAVAGHWVLTTDLAISTVRAQNGLHVTVRSLATANPLPGVRLQLLSLAQDVLAEAVTDAEGAAVFAPGLMRGQRGAAPAVLLARTDAADLALQDLTAPAFDLSDRGAEGRASPGAVEAYVYTDRGIYRPGETVQVTALLRTHGLAAVDDAALTLLLRRPDGVEASRVTLPPAPDAGFVQPLALTATAAQGGWTIEAYLDPSLPPVGRATVAVQDFVPQQLKVALSGPAALEAGAKLAASIDGRFLYGAPAAGLHAEGQIRLLRDAHPVASAPEYGFGVPDEVFPDAPQILQLDDANAAGHAAVDADLPVPDGIASPLRAEVTAGLTEPTGRAVTDTLSIPIHNHPLLIGVRTLSGGHVADGSAVQFAVRAFTPDGTPVARPGLQWRLVRINQHWDWWRGHEGSSGWTFHTFTTQDEVARGTVDVSAEAPAALARTLDWGDYRLVVSDAASGAGTAAAFSVGWGDGSASADTPDRLEVLADRATVGIGETAHVHVRAPFAGPAQVIVESAGRVLETRRIALPKEGATIDLPVSDAWGPGVHVLAEAVRPLEAPSRPHDPVRAVGLAWIATDPAPHTLGVSVAAPRAATPRQTLRVPVHVAGAHGRAFVTVSAVDEGILQLTHFASPDPVAALLGRTRFGLDLRDDYGRLLEGGAEAGALHEGGDGGASLGGEGLPVSTTQVVALFHGPVELDAAGNATVPLDLPDFAGELRLMAVAYDHDAAGHAEAALTVRDPVVAELSLPRFLAPGDTADVGVSLHNTDGPAGAYHLAVTASGAAAVEGPAALDMRLGGGERKEARLRLAGAGIGTGHLDATLTGPGGLRVTHHWDIAVRSPHPDLVLSRTDVQRPGETYETDPALLAAFIPGSMHLTVGYSSFAGIDVAGLLQSLYTYPYGCTEQLSSAALPLLYFNDARLLGQPDGDPGVRQRVQTAISTISDRQDAAGRFGLWRVADGAASVWLNVYALDFLLHARDAGFAVPDRVTTASARWIERQAENDGSGDDGAYAEPVQPTRAYAAYVLARTSRVDPSRLRSLANELDRDAAGAQAVAWHGAGPASPLSVAQLAGAQSLMGSPALADDSFALAIASLHTQAPPSWWSNAFFWSELRDEAGVLAVAAETGHDAVASAMLQRLGREHLNPEGMSTQEKAWLLVAAHALAKRGGTRSLSVDGAAPRAVALPYAVSPPANGPQGGVSVKNTDDKPVFRTVTVRGAPLKAPPALSNGFTVKRETFSLSGERLHDRALRQTDRFIVVLSGSAEDGSFRRAAVTDPLPAGLEIEAPVLKDDTYPFIGELTPLRAHEERDDRYLAVFDLGSDARDRWHELDDDKPNALEAGAFRVAYVVRAVTPGHFVRPETVVQDMYRPDVTARTASGQIDVAAR